MIKSFKELKFYIRADEIMNEQHFPKGYHKLIKYDRHIIHRFLRCMRILEYLTYKSNTNVWFKPFKVICEIQYSRLKAKTGFGIPINTIGYGVRLAHISTIIINGNTKIGRYCCLHNNIVIGDAKPKKIGDYVYIASNVTIAKNIEIADGCSISANSFQNHSALKKNMLWGGVISKPIKEHSPWVEEYPYCDEVQRCEELRKQMGITEND